MRKMCDRKRLAAILFLLGAAPLSGCATLGDPGPAICRAGDGRMVPLSDAGCPEEVRKAMRHDEPAPISIDQQMKNETYDAQHGLVAGDAGYR